MVRPPMPPSYFFLIDVSVSAVRSGLLEVHFSCSFISLIFPRVTFFPKIDTHSVPSFRLLQRPSNHVWMIFQAFHAHR
jgi:hypothetical protein